MENNIHKNCGYYFAQSHSKHLGTITLCDDRGANFAKAAIVSSTGRLRQATDGGDADTIVEGGGGANVTC